MTRQSLRSWAVRTLSEKNSLFLHFLIRIVKMSLSSTNTIDGGFVFWWPVLESSSDSLWPFWPLIGLRGLPLWQIHALNDMFAQRYRGRPQRHAVSETCSKTQKYSAETMAMVRLRRSFFRALSVHEEDDVFTSFSPPEVRYEYFKRSNIDLLSVELYDAQFWQ